MTKRIFSLVLALLMLLSITGCKAKENAVTDPSTAPTQTTTAPTETTEATAPTEEAQPPQLYWVFAEGGLRVRSGPGTAYEMVGGLADGDVVEPTKWENGWAYIEEPVAGWCSGDYLHKLGWYKDVKTPEGTPPADQSLKGKWVHYTAFAEAEGVLTTRAGIFRLRSNGTFIHMVSTYATDAEGNWAVQSDAADPYWVGEYEFDGKVLTLHYMAMLKIDGDTREWVEAIHTVELPLLKSADGTAFTSEFSYKIPLTTEFDLNMDTALTLVKASSKLGSPDDVCEILTLIAK